MVNHRTEIVQTGSGENSSSLHLLRRFGLYGFTVILAVAALMVWPFDRSISDVLRLFGSQGSVLVSYLVQFVTLFGKGDVLLVLGLVLAIHGRKRAAITACLAMLLAGLIVVPMRLVFERQRPNAWGSRSFPSGDTAMVTSFVIPIAAAFPATKPVAIVGAAAVSTSRVVLGRHFPSDVLVGAAIGVFAGAVMLSLKISLWPRIRRLFRRSWLPALLVFFVLIRLWMTTKGDLRDFLRIFGPAVALLTVAPFVRALLRSRIGNGIASMGWKRTLALGFAAILSAWFLFLFLLF